jgi:hypothetical protein
MQFFDEHSFKDFLGNVVYEENHIWGIERRFIASEQNIKVFLPLIRDTLYHHHSSFNFTDEIRDLGFPSTSGSLRIRNSGLPSDLKTQMGNLGEIIGAEFTKAYLNYQTTLVFPKRLNPNPNQSMKGIDILGLREESLPAEILLGEVKSYTSLDKEAIVEAYSNLKSLSENKKLPVLFHFAKEYYSLQNNSNEKKNVDRHMAENTSKKCLLLSITQSKPKEPFSDIPKTSELELLAVHIQLENIRSFLAILFG